METMNPYENEQPVQWIPQQGRHYDGSYQPAWPQSYAALPGQQYQQGRRPQQSYAVPQRRMAQPGAVQKPHPPEKMPKARALELARTLKRWLVVASFVSFGTIVGLAAFHQVGTTVSSTHSTSGSSQSSSSSSQSTNSSTSGGFFNQSGSSNFGSSSSSSTSSGTSVS